MKAFGIHYVYLLSLKFPFHKSYKFHKSGDISKRRADTEYLRIVHEQKTKSE